VALLPQNSSDTGGYSSSMLAGRGAFAPHSSEAAALRGLGAGPSALTRVAAGLLLRQVLGGVMSGASIEVAVHGLLLPALHMQVGVGLFCIDSIEGGFLGFLKKGVGTRGISRMPNSVEVAGDWAAAAAGAGGSAHMSGPSIEMAVHGLLLPALQMQVGAAVFCYCKNRRG
jgi:hypothetical protein